MSEKQRNPQAGKNSAVQKIPDNSCKKAQLKAAQALRKNSALLAIRAKCLDCVCDSDAEIRKCTLATCALYPFRMGKRPGNKPKSVKTAA